MAERNAINVCPVCSAPIEAARPSGIWHETDTVRNVPLKGTGYISTCRKCGAKLYSLPTDAEAEAREFFWEVSAPTPKQHSEVKSEREAVLGPLLETHASRSQVVSALGLEFKDYSLGSSSHSELRKWLFLDEVKEAASHCPGIFFHMDTTTMTWLFFDSDGRLQGYFVRSA